MATISERLQEILNEKNALKNAIQNNLGQNLANIPFTSYHDYVKKPDLPSQNTWFMNPDGDNTDGKTPSTGVTSLAKLNTLALQDGDTVIVCPGTYSETTQTTFTKVLNFIGLLNNAENPIFNQANKINRTLHFNLGDNNSNLPLSIRNLTVEGYGSADSGCIVINGLNDKSVYLDNVYVSDSVKQYNGEGVYISGVQNGSVFARHCNFNNITTTGYGHSGASLQIVGAEVNTVMVSGCVFNNPTSSRNVFGGIYGRAIGIHNWDNSVTIHNAIAIRNLYGEGDTNYNITETTL